MSSRLRSVEVALLNEGDFGNLLGRVTAIRRMGKAAFFDVRDESGDAQVADFGRQTRFSVGDIVRVTGTGFRTRSGHPSLHAQEIEVLARRTASLASWKAPTDRSTTRPVTRGRTLDLLADADLRSALRARSLMIGAIRRTMVSAGFSEADTPTLTPDRFVGSATPFTVTSRSSGRDLHLRGTLEAQLKKLVVAGFERVFEIGACFRNESLALAEFTMLEAMWAFATSGEMLQLARELFTAIAADVSAENVDDAATSALAGAWDVVDFWDVVEGHVGRPLREIDEVSLRKLAEQQRYGLAAEITHLPFETAKFAQLLLKRDISRVFPRPTFVGRFPAVISPLARDNRDDSGTADRGYAFFNGQRLCEVVAENHDPHEQMAKFRFQESLGVAVASTSVNEALLDALALGCPPAAGLGFNINRVLATMLGRYRTSDVLAFPLTSEPLPL